MACFLRVFRAAMVAILFAACAVAAQPAPEERGFSLVRKEWSAARFLHEQLLSFGSGRRLQAFRTLNSLFARVQLRLPNRSVSRGGIDITLTQLVCSEISVKDIEVKHAFLSSTTQRVGVSVTGLKVLCTFRWEYDWTIFNGKGDGRAVIDNSIAEANLHFHSPNYETHPPTDVSFPYCKKDGIKIANMDFDGDGLGFIGSVMNTFEGLLRDTVEEELGATVCKELTGLGDDALDALLLDLSSEIDTFIQPLSPDLADPLFEEKNTDVPIHTDGMPVYLNFQELDQIAGDWVQSALNQVDAMFGGSDSSGELGINSLIRENLLDEEGFVVVDPSLVSSSGEIFDGHDMLTETNMFIESIKMGGLDTFRSFDLLNTVGKHTLQNILKLDSLTIMIEIKAIIKASSLSDAVIVAPNSPAIEENFTVEITLNEIEIDFSIFVGMNRERLGNLELGSVLQTNDIIQCLLSTFDKTSFTGLSVSVADIVPPKLTGFLDSGIDHIISTGAVALLHMYEKVLIKAMPNFFQTYVRNIANGYLANIVMLTGKCPDNDAPMNGVVDFRDLLMSPDDAMLAGGSGSSPYGDVLPLVMGLVEDQLFTADNNGELGINDVIIRPLTKSLSGTEGMVKFNGTLVDLKKDEVRNDIWAAFAENLRLQLSNLRVSGIDTFREPLKILKPRYTSQYMLENLISLGSSYSSFGTQRGLEVSVEFGLVIGGEDSPLAMNNVIDLQFDIPSMELLAVLYGTMQESRLVGFPLKDIGSLDCWLSTMTRSGSVGDYLSEMRSDIEVGLSVELFDLLLNNGMMVKSSCISCSNSMLEELNSIIGFLDDNGFMNSIKSRAMYIASDILEGEWVQGIIDREMEYASLRCPHDPRFGSAPTNMTFPRFQASRDIVDGILYGGMTLVEVIAVVMAQKHSDIDIPSPADIMLDVPAGVELVDFTNLTSIMSGADMVVDQLRSYLGGASESKDGSIVVGMTSVLESLVLDEDGMLNIAMEDKGFEAGGVKLSLFNVTLIGLDSFAEVDILNVTGPQMLSNKVRLDKIGVRLMMGLSVEDPSSMSSRLLAESLLDEDELETVTVSLILKDVEVDFSLLLAMDKEILGNLKLGSIMKTNQIFGCIFLSVYDAALAEFRMSVGDIEEFSLSGFISNKTENEIEDMTEAILKEYKSVILYAMPAFTSTTIRQLLDNVIGVFVDKEKNTKLDLCPDSFDSYDELVDFRDLFLTEARAKDMLGRGDSPYGDLFRSIYVFIEENASTMNEDGTPKINDALISLFTESQSNVKGDVIFPGKIFNEKVDVNLGELVADIEIGIFDVRLSNIDTLGAPISLLEPMKGETSVLNNTASIGVGSEALRTSLTLVISGVGKDFKMYNELELGVSLKSLNMMLEVLAQVEESPFVNFPLRDALNPHCWLATMVSPALDKYGIRIGEANSGFVLRKLALAVAEARLDLNCISCSSSVLLEMSSRFSSKEGVADTTSVANMILEYGSNLLGGDFIQNQLDRLLNEAPSKCPHYQEYNPNISGSKKYEDLIVPEESEDSYGFLIATISVIITMIVLSSVIFVATRWISMRRHERWMKTLTRSQVAQLEREQEEERNKEKDLNERMKSMFRSETIPLFLRLSIPVVIVGNIGLFLSGHLSLGGTVNISGIFAGQEFDVDGFFEFSMAKSTLEMWKAGAKVLAMLIVIFSGAWPYTKQLITLFMWFVPPRRVCARHRGSVLVWLDVLGKWSMIDVFVLLMSLASFRISVTSPDHLAFLPDSLYAVNMLVVPLWGLYANMLAQLVSQISSHVIIHYHRKTIQAASQAQELEWGLAGSSDSNTTQRILRKHTFKLDYEASSKHAVIRKGVSWMLLASMASFVVLVICGCSLSSFNLEVLGLLGIAVESGQEFQEAKVYYSVFSLVKMIMDQARYLSTVSDFVGLGTLSSLLVITVFIVPLAQVSSLLAQWFLPMNKRQRERNSVVNEILSAWQYMEVYVLAIVIAAWQLGGVSEFMINAYCDPLEDFFASLAYYGILDKRDAQCFRVDANVDKASWLLVTASVVLFILNHFVTSASSQLVQDENIPTERRLHSDRWLTWKESTMTVSVEGGEELSVCSREKKISPVSPRFTDYYYFVTRRREQAQNSEVELFSSASDDRPSAIDVVALPTIVDDDDDDHNVASVWEG